ncbi:MAG TPA: hypothetical protein DCG63_11990 [Methylophilaceae bacterium]|nr:hypothetical protein [Methylophilaceae bacterium]
MQKTSQVIKFLVAIMLFSFSALSFAAGKVYNENEFLDAYSGKSKKIIEDKLGQPNKKQLSVKPSNAGAMLGKNLEDKSSKPVKVEMWYYKNLVKYDKKHTYKETEITFVNDTVMNIGFFNNR